MNFFLAELTGTMLLVLLGDGVVAGALLRGSKSEGAGWIVITVGCPTPSPRPSTNDSAIMP